MAAIALAAALSFGAIIVSRAKQTPPERDLAAEAREDLNRRQFRPLSAPLNALVSDPKYRPIPTQTHPRLGQAVPDFTLIDTDGRSVTLSDKWTAGPVVLVFYYGYHCNHCVSQLFGLNDDIEKFREMGASIVAVSADPPELTRKRYEKYGRFAFTVVADPGNKVAEQFIVYKRGAKEGDEGDLMHGTFLIDRDGKMFWANRGDGPFTENQTLLVAIHRREHRLNLP